MITYLLIDKPQPRNLMNAFVYYFHNTVFIKLVVIFSKVYRLIAFALTVLLPELLSLTRNRIKIYTEQN